MYNKKAVEKSIREFNEFLENFEEFGFRELTREELYKVNGGGEAEPDDTENSSENENDSGGFSGSETFSEAEAASGTEPASSITEAENESGSSSHTVESGDTLSEIVADYNEQNGTSYTYQEIAEQNGIENPDMIHPGDVIEFGNNAEKSDITDAGQSQGSSKTEGNGNAENSSFEDDFWSGTDSSDDSGNEENLTKTSAKDEQDEKSGNVYENMVVAEEKNGTKTKSSSAAVAQKENVQEKSGQISISQQLKTESKPEIDLIKEFNDIIEELKLGVSWKTEFSISKVGAVELEVDLFSKSFKHGEEYFTSGIKATVQGGADIAPMFQFGGEYSKEIQGMTPFDLQSCDYEFKPVLDVNTTGNITLPIPFGSITINASEALDFGSKFWSKIWQ